jgi:hypothetical protein
MWSSLSYDIFRVLNFFSKVIPELHPLKDSATRVCYPGFVMHVGHSVAAQTSLQGALV